jgi:hypothetical protein
MDSQDWVERYSYFGAMENMQGVNEANRLLNSKGKITDLGRQYIGEVEGDIDEDGGDSGNGGGVTVDNAAISSKTRGLTALFVGLAALLLIFAY